MNQQHAERKADCIHPPPSQDPASIKRRYRAAEGTKNHPIRNTSFVAPLPPRFHSNSMDHKGSNANRVPPPWSTVANPPWSTSTRPLSDIRELTEPSLVELTNRNRERGGRPSFSRQGSVTRRNSIGSRKGSLGRNNSFRESVKDGKQGSTDIGDLDINDHLPSSERTDASSAYSLALDNVPPKTSSRTGRPPQRAPSIIREKQPSLPPPVPRNLGLLSRTFVRTMEPNIDVLEFPKHQHPRVAIEIHAAASLFVGGGSVEGHVRFVVDDLERVRHRRQLAISRISVDLIGVEEMSSSRRNIFLNLATELIDSDNPPSHNMVESLKQISPIDPFWLLSPSVSHLPFMISLPLDVGPPPFHSKNARIRYVLSATSLIRDQGKQYLVRSSQEIAVLSVYDPEKALMSLPSPLTASDEYIRHRDHGMETIKVTAGLHRQVWVSGTSIFVDVAVINKSKKAVKRIELQLERDILCYKHVAATTLEKSAGQSRIFDSNERTVLSKSTMKQGVGGWNGVAAHSSDTRTWDLEIPRGHATVRCGKYFEVRYFLNVIAGTSHSKIITVQLPIVLIHMNSLDVIPNSVAQVAAAIEEKRSRLHHKRSESIYPDGSVPKAIRREKSSVSPNSPTKPGRRPSIAAGNLGNVQGRAFAAPRKQSLDKMRKEVEIFEEVEKEQEELPRGNIYSPRLCAIAAQHEPTICGSEAYKYHTPPSNRRGRVLTDDAGEEVTNRHVRVLDHKYAMLVQNRLAYIGKNPYEVKLRWSDSAS
ncbi:uncharacterized protein PV09_02808 [Verruconis gallopava]|uniref:Arrestin C-terminal-like domain-containing protein n=1 Tax=Verruconis gallopava TaxID=253628 RepID=A0A0D1XUB9_9PEZI|nr:uncharacterized protein PV09_02808 [Verruconis gallopava]KIW06346.1 hypothetical protein PV09_02808 [Verruconis gallopava]